ncbi:hypothetical protein [Kitasatospora sp. NPDC015120]|uniref:hypothetical protein n=1 Tax=Kitasatospora sp. NPDC015120 TaxID=3364023 RepID=UPI0036F4A99B
MYASIAVAVAARINNPGMQARAILDSVFVEVTPEDDRTVKISFSEGPKQGRVRVDLTLLDARKAHLDTITGTFPSNEAGGGSYHAFFEAVDAWYPPVS